MSQVQRTPRTLKNYLAVSKSSASQSTKDAFSSVKRVTRSQTRTAKVQTLTTAAAEAAALETPIRLKTRKRQQADESDIESNKKRRHEDADSASDAGLAKYFKVEKSQLVAPATRPKRSVGARKTVQPRRTTRRTTKTQTNHATATVMTTAQDENGQIAKPKSIDTVKVPEAKPQEPTADSEKKNSQKQRAEELLRKLRNRKVPASIPRSTDKNTATSSDNSDVVVVDKAPAPVANKQTETLMIKEDIAMRRLGIDAESLSGPTVKNIDVVFNSTTKQHSEAANKILSLNGESTKFELVRRRAFDLPLPERLTKLEAIFQAIEHTLMFALGQGRAWIFHRYRKSVENSCGYTFTLRHLAQIKYIYPDSYLLKSTKIQHQNRNIDSVEISVPKSANSDTGNAYSSSFLQARFAAEMIEKRRRIMREKLLDYVDGFHREFVSKSQPIAPAWKDIKQWHPDFSLDNGVPDLPQAELPNIESGIAKPDKDRIRKLLGKVAETMPSSATPETKDAPVANSASSPEPATLSAVPQPKPASVPVSKVSALLERIRAKEQRQKQEAMMGLGPEKVAERAMLSRLPNLADSISYIFYSQRKTVLPIGLLCEKLSQSGQVPLSSEECESHLLKISELVPDWCRIESLANSKIVRIIRIKSVRQVKQQLEENVKTSCL